MKSLIIALLALGSTAFAGTYSGIITQTITSSDNPLFTVGQTFIGSFQYESPTVDGDFYSPYPYSQQPSNTSLSGQIYFPFFNGSWRDFTGTTGGVHMTVNGGNVINFNYYYDVGNYSFSSGNTGGAIRFFSYTPYTYDSSTGQFHNYSVSGTFSFSSQTPEPNPYPAPESASTASLLLAVVGGLGLLSARRRFQR
ncbi:MAG: hypothetical protein NTV51_30585 [Verrucomicrobia bacterium]|nr:hypothetical protein [Verrucomicrobiota bacterium]